MSAHYDPMHVTGWTRAQMVNAVAPIALTVGGSAQMVAGSRAFTSQAIWTSDTPGVASIDASGLITAVGPGTAVMSVADGTFAADADVTVT